MKKLLAILLSLMMMALPVASFAEAEAPAANMSTSLTLSDLVVNVGGMDLDFTGMTVTANFASDGARNLFGASVTAGEKPALELTALLEGTVLTAVLFNAADEPVQPAMTVDAAPILEQIQQQMTASGSDANSADIEAVLNAVQETLASAETSEPYATDVNYPDGTTVPMTLTDVTIGEEAIAKLVEKIKPLVNAEDAEIPALTLTLTSGASEDGAHTFQEAVLSNEGDAVDLMLFGTTGETMNYDLVVNAGENTVAQGNLTVAMGEAGLQITLALAAGNGAFNLQANVLPAETGVSGDLALEAFQATEEGDTASIGKLSCKFAVAQEPFTAETFDAAASVIKMLPTISAEEFAQGELSEAAQQAMTAWMTAGMEALQVLQDVPAVQMVMSFVTMMTQAAETSGVEAAE